ncbi:hypothetical protein Gotur_032550, partial [Gossypium turneri]
HEFCASLKYQIVRDGTVAYVTTVTIQGVEVPLFPGDICEFYAIPFSEKDFTDGVDLDRLQNIDMEYVIKYLTQDPLRTEDEYEVAFQLQFSTLKGNVIRSPIRHAPSTGGSSHKEYAKGKGKAPMEKRQSP